MVFDKSTKQFIETYRTIYGYEEFIHSVHDKYEHIAFVNHNKKEKVKIDLKNKQFHKSNISTGDSIYVSMEELNCLLHLFKLLGWL